MKFFTLILLLAGLIYSALVEVENEVVDSRVGESETVSLVRVVDGDTIVVKTNGEQKTIRYIGIDTPEPYRDGEPACFSEQSSRRNKELLNGGEIKLVSGREELDRYDRLLRYVFVDNQFINETLIAEGYAKSLTISPNTKYATRFKGLEKEAKAQGLGLWGECF
jgi:micrococcal nuclease